MAFKPPNGFGTWDVCLPDETEFPDCWDEVETWSGHEAAETYADQRYADCDYPASMEVLARRRDGADVPTLYLVEVEMEPTFHARLVEPELADTGGEHGWPADDWIECPMCDGVGRVPKHEAAHVFRRGGYLREDEDGTVICPNCAGDGAV